MNSSTRLNWSAPHFGELLRFLDEINRETRSSEQPLYQFVDMGFVDRLLADRHHVIYGRRGAGKSAVLRRLESRATASQKISILVDSEQIVQKSYPNRLIAILLIVFRNLKGYLQKENFFKRIGQRHLLKDLDHVIHQLHGLLA